MKNTEELEKAYYKSPVGWLEIRGSKKGIRSLLYKDPGELDDLEMIPDSLSECFHQLGNYFQGSLKSFSLPLDMEGSDFQVKTWNQLLTIPYGKTITYLELAVKTGDLKAIRAVGHANGQNQLNIIVPCHRVIGANGKLTGYGGGLWRKEWLLKFEKANEPEGLFAIQNDVILD